MAKNKSASPFSRILLLIHEFSQVNALELILCGSAFYGIIVNKILFRVKFGAGDNC